MTHASGVRATQDAIDAFTAAREDRSVRIFKMEVVDTEIKVSNKVAVSGTFEESFRELPGLVDEETPCYLLVMMDETSQSCSSQWVLYTYATEKSKIRERMLIASSVSDFRKDLGPAYIPTEMFASEQSELSHEHFVWTQKKDVENKPLTASEVASKAEAAMERDMTTSSKGNSSVGFGMDVGAVDDAISSFQNAKCNLIEFVLDIEKERVGVGNCATVLNEEEVGKAMPQKEPRFFLYQSDEYKKTVFIYSSPDYTVVKARMLYSTNKAPILSYLHEKGIEVHQKIECGDYDQFLDSFRPKADTSADGASNIQTYSKPAGPGKGPRRLPPRKKE